MQYMLLIHTDDTPFRTATDEQRAQMSAPYAAYNEALIKAGAMVSGERLRPASASTTVKVRDDRTEVLDGPFADTRAAGRLLHRRGRRHGRRHKMGRALPGAAHGTVEVRPIWPMR